MGMINHEDQILSLAERVSILETTCANVENRKRIREANALIGSRSDVLPAVAEAWGLPLEMLRGDYQGRECSEARHAALYLLRERTGWSYPMLGHACNRHHTTVMYGIARAAAELAKGGEFARKLERAKEILCGKNE